MKGRVSRRDFLRAVSAGTCGAAIHTLTSPYENMVALAQGAGNGRVFVLVNLAGGCSHNIVPIYHGAYRDENPTISYSEADSLPLNAEQGLHPSLTALKACWDTGRLAVCNLVGYPNPNRSHDESTDIWHRGTRLMGASNGGWGARLTCQMNSIFGGVSLGGSNVLITGDCNPPRAFASLDQNAFGERGISGASSRDQAFLRITRDQMNIDSAPPPAADNYWYVRTQADNLAASLTTIKNATNQPLPDISPITFPNTGFGRACQNAARLLQATAIGTQFIYLQDGGYDTHAGERTALANNLTRVNGGLNALIATAFALGRWQDLVIVTMTEFCRTFENGSQGTDHGHAGPVLIAGGAVNGGIYAPAPTPAETTSQGYYHNYHIDFRGIFHEVIQFLGYDPGPVFPEAFSYTRLGILG
ncbi:MAG: DUF1501 domain-containing protein [Deltaproteobacteria bacterium]|nr:DUF1501 domain-containing protein [Deltaproteobacteria bacterium]